MADIVLAVDPSRPHWPVVFRDGLVARVAAAESHGAMAVQFGDDAPIALPSYGLYPIGAIVGGLHTIILESVDDVARVVSRDGVVTVEGPCTGTDAVWMDDAAVVVRVETLYTVRYAGVVHDHPYPGGQGIAEAGNRPFESIAWMDARLAGTVHGRSVCRWSAAGAYTVAQDAHTGYGIVHDGVAWRVAIPAALVVAPRVTVLENGSAVVWSFPGYVVPEAQWTPIDGPIDPPIDPIKPPIDPIKPPIEPPIEPPIKPPIEPEEPVIPDISGAEYEVYLDHRAQELIRAFSTHLHEELGGLSLPDARAQAHNACDYMHSACDKAGKPRRIALPEEIQTICRIYWGDRDTAPTEEAIRAYCFDTVRLR